MLELPRQVIMAQSCITVVNQMITSHPDQTCITMEFETPMDCMFFEHTVTFIQSLGRVNTYYPRLVAPLRLVKDIGDRSTQPRSPTTVLLFRLNTTKEFPLNPLKRKGTFEENSDGIKTLRLTPPDEDEIKVEGEGENNHDPNMQVDSPDSDSETESL